MTKLETMAMSPDELSHLAAQPRFARHNVVTAIREAQNLWELVARKVENDCPKTSLTWTTKELRPELMTLAVLSAGPRFKQLEPKAAVAAAFEFWGYARSFLHLAMFPHLTTDAISEDERKAVPNPRAFPATLKEFLKLVVRKKTEADSLTAFRQFLKARSTSARLPPGATTLQVSDEGVIEGAAREIAFLKQCMIFKASWYDMAIYYKRWQSESISKTRATSGRKGGTTKRTPLTAQESA